MSRSAPPLIRFARFVAGEAAPKERVRVFRAIQNSALRDHRILLTVLIRRMLDDDAFHMWVVARKALCIDLLPVRFLKQLLHLH